jgi:hypothetical protein
MWIAVFSVALALAISCGVAAMLLSRPLRPINGRNAY